MHKYEVTFEFEPLKLEVEATNGPQAFEKSWAALEVLFLTRGKELYEKLYPSARFPTRI